MLRMCQRQLIQRLALIEMSPTLQTQGTASQRCNITIIEHHRVLWAILDFGDGRLHQVASARMFDFNGGTNAQRFRFDLVIGYGACAQSLFVCYFAFDIAHDLAHFGFAEGPFVFGANFRAHRQIGRIVHLLPRQF